MARKPKTEISEPIFRLLPQRYEMRAVDSLQPHPQNANEGDVGAIVESIDENGFFGAVLVQASTGRILAGKHRWASAIERGDSGMSVS